MQKLRGPGGTKVTISVLRRGAGDLIDFTIIRGKIPIYSVDVAYMVNDSTGYIKISRFAATTYEEFLSAAEELSGSGMRSLILDLRGNPGGYLDAATKLADEFLPEGKLIVYTEGKSRPRTSYNSTSSGNYQSLPVTILIDEGSASASEIVAGAVQDWDRGTIVGRRSFGKGLVQEQTTLPDGSAIRLTIARYYTPTGRSIQKPYTDDIDAYYNELNERILNNELYNADSVKFPDSLKYTTPGGKVVYGGGGIMPDVFVPIDTAGSHLPFLVSTVRQGMVSQFSYNYVDRNRQHLNRYGSFEEFDDRFRIDDRVYEEFIKFARGNGVEATRSETSDARDFLSVQLKAFIARQLFNSKGFYPIIHRDDKVFRKALELMKQNTST
jgi:carboxyl-terminal processing protease